MESKRRMVAWWLIAGVIMIIVQTLLGGITRLTGSGLSITKWNPLFGILPPLNTQQWNDAFEGYKQIGQFRYINSYYTLADFKSIFFWEWLHRFWARMLGIVFAVGFIYFFVKKYFDRQMVKPFVILFLLGGLQGLIGWLMVKTGLNSEDIHVNYIALAVHFVSAMLLACYTLWFALQLLIPNEKRTTIASLNSLTIAVIAILFLQLTYGAFMAGLKAAPAAHTWPDINGSFMPHTVITNSLLHDNDLGALSLNVQFVHRSLAYLLLVLIMFWFVSAGKQVRVERSALSRTRQWPLILVLAQVVLGITAVLLSPGIVPGKFGVFEIIAELHQMVAMFLLMSLVVNLYVIKRA